MRLGWPQLPARVFCALVKGVTWATHNPLGTAVSCQRTIDRRVTPAAIGFDHFKQNGWLCAVRFPVPFQLLDPTNPCAWIDVTNWNPSGNYACRTSREFDHLIVRCTRNMYCTLQWR